MTTEHSKTELGGASEFNRLRGRLRFSVTHACQLRCVFCHREAIQDHWKPIHVDVPFFEAVTLAFRTLGGTELNITGGDPLLHPRIADLLEIAASESWQVALCTNGLLLDRVIPQLKRGLVDRLKVSLHGGSETSSKSLLGNAWDYDVFERNLLNALDTGTRVTLNFTYLEENRQWLEQLLARAESWGADVLVIDLIDTRWGSSAGLHAMRPSSLENRMLSGSVENTEIVDRTGCRMRVFRRSNGTTWTIKDTNYGVLYTAMCQGCSLKQSCGEGVFVLRVDAERWLKPCLLRRDLDRQIRCDWTYADVIGGIQEGLDIMFPAISNR